VRQGFKLRPKALADVRQIWDSLAEKGGVTAADRLLEHFYDACRMLADLPGIGHTRTDLTDRAMLFWTVGDYHVIYHPEVIPLEVERIFYAGRDIKRELSQNPA